MPISKWYHPLSCEVQHPKVILALFLAVCLGALPPSANPIGSSTKAHLGSDGFILLLCYHLSPNHSLFRLGLHLEPPNCSPCTHCSTESLHVNQIRALAALKPPVASYCASNNTRSISKRPSEPRPLPLQAPGQAPPLGDRTPASQPFCSLNKPGMMPCHPSGVNSGVNLTEHPLSPPHPGHTTPLLFPPPCDTYCCSSQHGPFCMCVHLYFLVGAP